MSRLRNIAIAVLPFTTTTLDPIFGGETFDVPTLPGSLTAQREGFGWWTLRTAEGVEFHLWVAGRNAGNTRILVLLAGPAAVIQALASAFDNVWSIAELRAANDATALAVKRRWPFWRCTGTDAQGNAFTDTVRRLPTTPPLPATALPWSLSDGTTVTAITGVAFGLSMAGFRDHEDAEDNS